jgi:hypothetical protein
LFRRSELPNGVWCFWSGRDDHPDGRSHGEKPRDCYRVKTIISDFFPPGPTYDVSHASSGDPDIGVAGLTDRPIDSVSATSNK